MKEEKVNYGNWISKKRVYVFFVISIILILISLFPIFIVVRIGIIIFAGISLLTFLIFLYFYI